MYFSRRIPASFEASPFALRLEAARRRGSLIDLTRSSPLQCGISLNQGALLAHLANVGDWRDHLPDPRGLLLAREAIAERCRMQGGECSPRDVFCTASTSEAYAHLFRLLCDSGHEVLVPQPGYPLLDVLAGLEGLVCVPYTRSLLEGSWQVDWAALESQLRTARVLVVVNPCNPTGAVLTPDEWLRLARLCARESVHLVVDVVFADFVGDMPPPYEEMRKHLSFFVVDGLSKCAGLPQWKLGWIRVVARPLDEAAIGERLEWVSDAWLGASPVVQCAAPWILQNAAEYRERVSRRLRENLDVLYAVLGAMSEVRLPVPFGGWSFCIQIIGVDDETIALRLLEEKGVVVQPGFLYDFAEGDWLVVSLLGNPKEFRKGLIFLRELIEVN